MGHKILHQVKSLGACLLNILKKIGRGMVAVGQNGYTFVMPNHQKLLIKMCAHTSSTPLCLLVKDYMHANATWLACGPIEIYVSTFYAISKREKIVQLEISVVNCHSS